MDLIMWEAIAPMIVGIILILTVGGVVLLRPLSQNLSHLLEAMARERQDPPGVEDELLRMRETMETFSERLHLIEERQDFTERLLERPRGSEGGESGS